MATLAADKVREYGASGQDLYNDLPIVATDTVYEGAACGEDGSGYARPLVAADPFLGFAVRQVANEAGAAGAKNVRVRSKGLVKLPISGLAITANDGARVYASDDDTFTLTNTGNSYIGQVFRWISTGVAIVYFEAVNCQTYLDVS